MRRIFFISAGALAVLMLFSVACGGGGDDKATTTAGATKTAAVTTHAAGAETTASAAQLATYLTTIKAVLADTIAKAQAGDVQGTRDAEGKGDTAMEAIIKAVRPLDSSLADQIEALELDYEAQADADNTDLSVIIKDAQTVLPLLDQAGVKLKISSAAEGTPVSSAQLATYLTTIKTVLADTIAKAQAGDVQGTRDAEGKGDTAMEAIIKATRLVDASLADRIETLELDYEAQADADNTDLSVIIKDAQTALTLLDQAAAKLSIP